MSTEFSETDTYPYLCEELESLLPSNVECRFDEDVTYNLRYGADHDTRENEFSTDLTVFEDDDPRVIVEVKRNNATTHDLMAYDTKARRHKLVYPALRYGMLLLETSGLTKKYLWHSGNLDFFYFVDHEMKDEEDIPDNELEQFADILHDNIESSHQIGEVLEDESKPTEFRRRLRFD